MTKAKAATVTVSSVSALQTAITNSSSGDVLVLTDGTYTTNNALSISKSNITVRAGSTGGVIFSGTRNIITPGSAVPRDGSNIITISGSNVTFSGFQFVNSTQPDTIITVSGNNNTITECNWSGATALRYIRLSGGSQFNTISYCNFEKKGDNGITSGLTDSIRDSMIQVDPDPTIVDYHKIRYCSFQNTCPTGTGGDFGNEPIRIGEGALSAYVSRTIVEYCYFNNTGLADSEAISIKSCENVIRYCTFDNNPLAMLSVRRGDYNSIYGNFFINGSGGIRIKESDNTWCYNNYFSTGSATPVYFDYITADSTTGLPISKPNNANFIFNTFVDCAPIDLGGTGPASMTFANNIFKNASGSIFTNTNGSTTGTGNIYSGTLGVSISGMTNINPQLVLNSDGYYGLSSTSPAIDAASASYPAIQDIANVDDDPSVLLDISGQARPATATLKDVGCDEFTTGTITNRPLKVTDVGPTVFSITTVALANGIVGSSYSQTLTAASGTGTLTWSVAAGTLPPGLTLNSTGIFSGTPTTTGTFTFTVGVTDSLNAHTEKVLNLTIILPSLSIGDVSLAEGNTGTTNFVFAVTLSAATVNTVAVNYATAQGTATTGTDYIAQSGTLTFAPGVTTQTITVAVNGDTVVEPNETFFVNLSSSPSATLSRSQGTGTILNDDGALNYSNSSLITINDNAVASPYPSTITVPTNAGQSQK